MQVQEILLYGNLIAPMTIISSLSSIYFLTRLLPSRQTPASDATSVKEILSAQKNPKESQSFAEKMQPAKSTHTNRQSVSKNDATSVKETLSTQKNSQEPGSFAKKMQPAKSTNTNRQSVRKNNAYRLACYWDEFDSSKFGLFIMRREYINGKWQFNLDYQLKYKTTTLDPNLHNQYVKTGLRKLGLAKGLQEEINNLVQQGNTDPVKKLVVVINTTKLQREQVYNLYILLANGIVYKYTITIFFDEKMHLRCQYQRCVNRSRSVKDLYAPRHMGKSVCRYLHDNGSINVAGSKSVLEPYVQKLTNEIGEGFMFEGQNLSQEQMGDCIQGKIAWINRSDSGEPPQHFAGRISPDKKTFEVKKTFIDELYEYNTNSLGLTEQEVTQLSEMNDRARLGQTDNDQKPNQESPFLTIKFSDEIHSLIEEKNLTIEKVHATENHSYLILSDGTLLWAGNCRRRNNENGLWQIALRGDSPDIRPVDPNQHSHLTPEIHTSDMWENDGELIYLINGHALYYGPFFLRKQLDHPADQSGSKTICYFTNLLAPETKIPIHGSVQNSQQKDKTTNKTHYAFSDSDIRILLKGLKQRDRENLDSDKICLDPVTLEDNSLQLILDRYIRFFEGEEARDQVSLLCPIKIMGEFHWNLLEIKKNGEIINVSLYDTNGYTKPLDGHLKSALSSQFGISELTFEDGVRQVWTKPGQKGVNCGLIVALMAHQLSLKSDFESNMDLYAGIDPELSDQEIRDTVSMIVEENCEEKDRGDFCKIRPTEDWVAKVKGITYDPKNEGQKQLYEACNALEEGDFQRIKTQIDSFDQSEMSDGMSELITSLSKLDCAKFLFKYDGSREFKEFAIDIVKYVIARKEATLAKNMSNIGTGDSRNTQSEEQSAVEIAANLLVSNVKGLNQSGLKWLYETLRYTLLDNGEDEKGLAQLDNIYQILQEDLLLYKLSPTEHLRGVHII